MTAEQLIDLLDQAVRELTLSGTTFEAEQLQKKIALARTQLTQPYPALVLLRRLCESSAKGLAMDRHTDTDVMALWALADRALTQPFVPSGPGDTALAFEETVIDPGGWIQLRKRCEPAPGDVVQVWRKVKP